MEDQGHIKNIRDLFDLWLAHNDNLTFDETHVCPSDECNVVNIAGYIDKKNKVRLCTDRKGIPKTAKVRYQNLYVCTVNGVPHWCGNRCEHQERDQYGYVCKMSGRRSESAISDTWVPQYRISATSQESKDPKALGELVHTGGGRVVKSLNHLEYASKTVFNLLFSTTRMFAEQRKYADQKVESEKMVARYIKQQTVEKNMACYTTIIEKYIHTMRSRRIFFALVPKCSNAERLSNIYAEKIVQFWRVITQKTPFGQTNPNTFSFVNFVCPALYMMRNGLVISNVHVIPRCQLLCTLLPEANTLDNYDVSKPMFTQTKNNILKALRDAHDVYKIPATDLMTFKTKR